MRPRWAVRLYSPEGKLLGEVQRRTKFGARNVMWWYARVTSEDPIPGYRVRLERLS